MPTQRTLLTTIASLLVMVSFLIGYISGNKVAPHGKVTTQNNSERVVGSNPVFTKLDDPAARQTGSSYNSVYKEDEGKVYPPKHARDKSHSYQDDSTVVNEKPEFVFRERVKAKKPYSWASSNNLASRNRNSQAAGSPSVSAFEQGDGGQYRTGQRRPLSSVGRPGSLYYLPTPPPVTSPYGMTAPVMQNPYMAYPPMPGFYPQYGR